jgi:hypothetical protein
MPGYVARMDQESHIVAMVPDVLEEDATAEKRNLEGLDINVGMISSPGVGADGIGDNGRKYAVEVGEEEDGTW